MAETKPIRGRIIRILDRRTVLVNLGSEDGVTQETVFRILGAPEDVKDPDTGEELGAVTVVKRRIKANQVFAKFTVASTRWTMSTLRLRPYDALAALYESKEVDEGDLQVDPSEIRPWKGMSETPVRVGDVVETDVSAQGAESAAERTEKEDNSGKPAHAG